MKAIYGRKMGMTQVFANDGTMYPVTVVEVLPNVVTQVKTLEKDGYVAVQIGYEDKKETRANKCEKGIAKKANITTHEFSGELRGDEMGNYTVGSEIKASIFAKGEIVDVIGTSKGKGYTGTIKRWNMIIGPKGHGSGYHRGQGSFSNNGRCNNRVIPGKHMSGHSGNQSATILNVVIVDVNEEKGYILVKGGIPGATRSIVKIRSAIKNVNNSTKKRKQPKTLLIRKTEEPKVEEVKVEETPVAETPVVEAPVTETPVVEAPAVETPTKETPKTEETKEAEAAPTTEAPAETK